MYLTVSVPVETPVTPPVKGSTETNPRVPLHTPPGVPVGSVSVITAPAQTLSAPMMVPATIPLTTVTECIAVSNPQLNDVTVYIISAVPASTPATTPDGLTVAIVACRLLHTPPEAVSVNVIPFPIVTKLTPEIDPASGSAFTVILCLAVSEPHAVAATYAMATVPGVIPVTRPPTLTVAMDGSKLTHTPVDEVLVRVTEAPAQTLSAHEIDPVSGNAFVLML